MKREIKFRYWNSYSRSMIENVGFHPELDMNLGADPNLPYIHGGPMSRIIAPPFPDLILMQFTGLKDKNGVDIYEGDIIRLHHFYEADGGNGGVIEAENSFIGVIRLEEYAWAITMSTGFEYLNEICGLHEESFEVIGNIHQHPHLLNAPKQ